MGAKMEKLEDLIGQLNHLLGREQINEKQSLNHNNKKQVNLMDTVTGFEKQNPL